MGMQYSIGTDLPLECSGSRRANESICLPGCFQQQIVGRCVILQINGRSSAGTVKVIRKYCTGSNLARSVSIHCWLSCVLAVRATAMAAGMGDL